ncbi:hypothetical protein LX16_3578 [Stackebrandtia albiflava]|uniref:Uncharacterized protein n=1 Tax=Stackebrandtia albiflava TaxID=406432 RepID=A0A562V4Q7_9ACTN|nr:hypothetical protein [Stackebrandtia albiflava]TWJ12812.1 hypothetical protein LX16_3578 [Stackebrandtia albiflava]
MVEWVGYSASRVAQRRFLFPTFYDNRWTFDVGRYPYHGGEKVAVSFSKGGRHAEQPEGWTFLVDLSRRYLEPRLRDELLARVHRGETVTVGGSVEMNRDGISCVKPRFSLPWNAVSPPTLQNGLIVIARRGVAAPLVTVPLGHPNAVLIPDLYAALAR